MDLPTSGSDQKKEDGIKNNLKDKRALVTGGCGFIGINLIQELIDRGAEVTALDLPSADWKRLPKGVRQVKADILKKSQLKGMFDDLDIVYHLAARTDLDGSELFDYKVNYEGTQNIIEECKKLDRFVFYSTQLVVGLFNETRFIDETEPYRTKTVYGQSKIEGEKIVKEYCEKAGIDYTIIRPTSVYGPWGESPYREFFQTIKHGRYFHIGKADNLVSLVFVKNLVEQTVFLSLSTSGRNEIFFGNDFHPYAMREIVDSVAQYYGIRIATIPSFIMTLAAYGLGIFKMTGINVPIYPFRLKNIKASYCYDMSKTIKSGFLPRYELKEGVRETLDWYEEQGEKKGEKF